MNDFSPFKVSGWGLTGIETGTYSETLLTANLTFISRDRCLTTVPEGFKEYVTFDKFCAGAEGGEYNVLMLYIFVRFEGQKPEGAHVIVPI